ncbi:MAG: CBS domain-containing protein, partial [Actinobacteria bacterium]|nr:CBS domain-containing protein [Actinomycetota bacterium]
TTPDVWSTYLDGHLRFTLKEERSDEPSPAPIVETIVETNAEPQATTVAPADPTYRLARLPSANATPLSVHPDDPLQLAVSHMIKKDFSQLPVMETPYRLKGIISWASIARRQCLGIAVSTVRDCIDPPHVLDLDTSLFAAIQSIYRNDYALVRHPDYRIGGIVTTADLTLEFHTLAEPFLLIGEIENHLRRLIGSRFSLEDLRQARNTLDHSRDVAAVDDLTLGEYIRLLQAEDNWNRLSLRLDRAEFVKWLDQVRQVRNDVMHFDPDPVSPEGLQLLREVTRTMQTLRDVGAV